MCHNIPWYPVLSHNIPIKMAIVPIVVVKFLEFPPSSVNSSMIDPYFIISRREKRNHWKNNTKNSKEWHDYDYVWTKKHLQASMTSSLTTISCLVNDSYINPWPILDTLQKNNKFLAGERR